MKLLIYINEHWENQYWHLEIHQWDAHVSRQGGITIPPHDNLDEALKNWLGVWRKNEDSY